MVQEIEKEVSEQIERLAQKTKRLSVKLVSFVISCWLVIGSIALGLVAPMYAVKSAMKIEWVKEASAANVSPRIEMRQTPQIQYGTPWNARNYTRETPRKVEPPALRSGLRETGNTLTELRNLARGVRQLMSR